jgi:hypothetical protein
MLLWALLPVTGCFRACDKIVLQLSGWLGALLPP